MTATLVERVLAGDQGGIARLLTRIERRAPGVAEEIAALHEHTGTAHVVGITGPPGSGKSTLVSALAVEYRRQGRSVGILAVDPSSAYSGGAILGDRIRMNELSGDPDVYIRSLATRGALGGLSRAVVDGLSVLDAAGKDVILLETVGVGQVEVDIMGVAHSTVVVSIPGAGDAIQAIKAGLLEVADVHVVNKADSPGADRTVSELRDMLRLSRRKAFQWNVPVQKTSATRQEGVVELIAELDKHLGWMREHGVLDEHVHRLSATRVRWAAEETALRDLRPGVPEFDAAVDEVAQRRTDPLTAARTLLGHHEATTPDPATNPKEG
ncbi:methylmalonyl Co-A mutase-associated GTPase MeaB [Ornithinimicrobium avium]|uniref:Methylmalonyl Co-A mutase-associated GTPase MeaB n=1 Tax=Ornithinimicrobium avium TaxID=2283195 RepID=A0A345NNR6_9MICO|nr:methylmalonyl Co-A mutase-associated GTPase MeaB [Ornithinimicrobium avium]AXH96674.1 methylmalonyl Co-A mutase-associated GTPase MeaB [Ornithinimicrobium avium]